MGFEFVHLIVMIFGLSYGDMVLDAHLKAIHEIYGCELDLALN